MWSSLLLILTVSVTVYKHVTATVISQGMSVTPQYLDYLLNTDQLEKFMKLLQIPFKDLVDPSQRKDHISQAILFNGLNHTDMLMRPGQVLNENEKLDINGIINLKINTWKNGIIPYYVSSAYSSNQTIFIENDIKLANRLFGPNIKLRHYEDGDTDYVFIFQGGCGCYSNLGHVGGPQVISMPPVCMVEGFILHNLHHVFGIGHEHNRFDRDNYIQMRPENIPKVFMSQYTRYNAEALVNVGPFDYYSIVGFPTIACIFKVKAFEILQDGIDESKVGIDRMVTRQDIRRVKTIYRHF